MSSQKRKLEEYHDPDYLTLHTNQSTSPNDPENPTKKTKWAFSAATQSTDERLRKVREIIQREFGIELMAKEQEIDEIERRLASAKQLLAKVRYAVVSSYYTRKNLVHSAFDLKAMDPATATTTAEASSWDETATASMPATLGADPDKLQPAIHPSLKKLLGKHPIDYNELLKVRPVRQAAKAATQNFHKTKKSTKMESTKVTATEVNTTIPSHEDDDSNEVSSAPGNEIKIPRYVAPNATPNKRIEQVNSARGRNQYRHLLVVGNTSKYIGDEERDSATNVTHKWLVYIATMTAVPIDKIVSKVRFFLHESYRPNDLVEVLSAPFQIAKRGWGEFPLRVQLYFHPHLQQKPIQIVHNLVLDKKHSGLQTMGAETVVEIWLNLQNSIDAVQSTSEKARPATTVKETTHKLGEKSSAVKTPNPVNLRQHIKSEQELQIDDGALTPCKITKILEPRISAGPPLPTTTSQVASNFTSLPKMIAVNAPTVNASSLLVNATTGKRFMKCVDKTGKVSLIEMIADPNNPKIIKMILPSRARTTSLQASSSDANKSKILMMPAQLITSNTSANASGSSSVVRTNTIRAPIVVSKPREKLPFDRSSSKTVILPNGKVVFTERAATTSRVKQLAQQSLLRPQISLLKPQKIEEKPAVPVSIGTKGLKMITVNNLSGMENRNINVYLPTECQSEVDIEIPNSKRFVVITKKRQQLACDLETEFHRCVHFPTVTASVVWLLKRLPLISPLAHQHDYKESFPFVVASIETFDAMPTVKQRCFEWLRAKFISRLISNHMLFRTHAWTTKQIIVFARTYGYSPMPISDVIQSANKDGSELKEIVKSELLREHLQNDSISFNRPIVGWLTEAERNLESRKRESNDGDHEHTMDEIVIIDDVESVANKQENQLNDAHAIEAGKLYLPIETRFQDECSWITDMCRDVQTRLQPEEIVEGVVYPATQTVLAVALRSFVEDLLRRSTAHSTLRATAVKLSRAVTGDDVQRALAATNHFDFLTNKRFGIGTNIAS